MFSAASRDMRHETMKVGVATLGSKDPDGRRKTDRQKDYTPDVKTTSVFIIYFIKTCGP